VEEVPEDFEDEALAAYADQAEAEELERMADEIFALTDEDLDALALAEQEVTEMDMS
jgi:hypothetical protein